MIFTPGQPGWLLNVSKGRDRLEAPGIAQPVRPVGAPALSPARRGFSLFAGLLSPQEHQISAARYSVTMDGIVILAAVLCVVALALLLTAKIEPR